MENITFTNKKEFAHWLMARTKKFAIDCINYCKKLPKNPGTQVVNFQLIKSSTSIAANYRAACRARSAKEFYAKLCIVVEEADETLFWLEIIEETESKKEDSELQSLQKESLEILKILSKSRKNAKTH